jgi:methylamine--corrinoid protein Co-methyltransferase
VYKNATLDLQTPQGPLFAAEIAHAVRGMGRKEANTLVNRLLERYEGRLKNPPRGKTYQESYDVESGKPLAETEALYTRMRRQVSALGVKFTH